MLEKFHLVLHFYISRRLQVVFWCIRRMTASHKSVESILVPYQSRSHNHHLIARMNQLPAAL